MVSASLPLTLLLRLVYHPLEVVFVLIDLVEHLLVAYYDVVGDCTVLIQRHMAIHVAVSNLSSHLANATESRRSCRRLALLHLTAMLRHNLVSHHAGLGGHGHGIGGWQRGGLWYLRVW